MILRTKLVAAAAAALVLVGAGVGTALHLRARRHAQTAASTQPAQELQVGDAAPVPAAWIDVQSPAAAWKAVRANAWLGKALSEPLGQGFTTGWSAFLGTRGTDLAGAFEGTMLDLVLGKLLVDPFRVVFFAGDGATGAPAVIVPRPSGGARSAFELLEGAARNGRYQAARCPGDEKDRAEKLEVSRWLVADHAVFAGSRADRLVLAKNPVAVVQALCAELPEAKAERGVDLSVTVARDALGREAQLGAALLGLGETPRFLFAVEGDQLKPRGIAAALEEKDRLQAAAPPEGLLKLLPVDAGLVLLATVNLPDALDRDSLKAHLGKRYTGKLAPRTVALVWNPRGDGTTEVALAWPERDARALKEAFSGPNEMVQRRACGHVVLASTGALASAMERSCAGRGPSLLNGPPAVVEGLKQPLSLGVNVNVGPTLSHLLGQAYAAEHSKGPASPEIDSARRLLEELPFFGLRGVVKDGALVPGGFRS